jgi:pilus assembly protein CpaF
LTEDIAKFLEACVVSRRNIIVSGGTGSGKTTLINVLSSYIPEGERVVTIEDAAERIQFDAFDVYERPAGVQVIAKVWLSQAIMRCYNRPGLPASLPGARFA